MCVNKSSQVLGLLYPMQFKKYRHNPPHLFIDGAFYFITGGILNKQYILGDGVRKKTVQQTMEKWFSYFDWQLHAWIILGNHYHLIAKAELAKDMPTIMIRMHSGSATLLNQLDGTPGRQVWWNYWDTCIRDENDCESRMAYIYWNAVKHGIVAEPNNYPWSSFTLSNQAKKNCKRFGKTPPDDFELKDNFDDF